MDAFTRRTTCSSIRAGSSERSGSGRGAQKWVGRARWNYGSFYFWGDVPALMPIGKPKKQEGDPSWFYDNYENSARRFSSKSPQRKQWSAMIAKIPFELAHWIGRAWLPPKAA